jgi:DNA-binding response OmpR family regulator
MIKSNIAVYRIPILFKILEELELSLNLKVIYIADKKDLKRENLTNFLILTNTKLLQNNNYLKLDFPIKVSKLIEKINIEILKLQTKEKSSISIGNYEVNLNSRELKLKPYSVNLTEKEINLIMFLNDSNCSVKPIKLQSEVWSYKSNLESHTVETHIHRLRKKILNNLHKDNFILSDKNGYYLNK